MEKIKPFLLTMLVALFSSLSISAHDFEAKNEDGVTIYYKITSSSNLTCAVSFRGYYSDSYSNEYSGAVIIPSSVVYNSKAYSVTSIGSEAFSRCSSLTSVTIPQSVTSIGSSAFYYCSGLISVYIPESVTSIESDAFRYCSNLRVVINKSSLNIQKGSSNYGCVGDYAKVVTSTESSDGLYYEDDAKTKLLAFDGRFSSVTIPQSVTSIGYDAFRGCSCLISVYIPESVTSIGYDAFYDCSNLRVVINKSSLDIQKGASNYEYVGYYAKVVTSTESSDGLYYEDDAKTKLLAFDGRFSSVTIPQSVTSIGYDAFYGCSGIERIIIPNKVTEIGSSAFSYCSNLKSVVIGTGVISVGNYAFRYCSNLHKMIVLPNTKPNGLSLNGSINYVANNNYSSNNLLKKYDYLSSLFEVDGVIYVPVSPSERTCAVIDCTYDENVKDITIGKTVNYRGVQLKVVEINPYVLIKNKHVENINISSETDIQKYFAYSCNNLKTLELSNVGNIGNNSFNSCTSLSTITLNNIGSIGDYAFRNCTGLQELTVGNTVTNIGDYAFDGSMTKSKNAQISLNNKGTLGTYAFNGCTKLVSATLGNDISNVGEYCFSGCTSLPKIDIPSSVESLGKYSFSGCTSLAEITLNEGLKTIGDNSFQNTIPTSIVIPATTTSIGNGVFNGCKSLESFMAKDGNEFLNLGYNSSGKGLFYDCPLKSVKIGRNLKYSTSSYDGYSPFYRNTNIESVIFTDVPTEVFTNEFYGCSGIKNVSLGDGMTKIGDYAFSGCSSIEEFSFGASVQEIGAEAFSDCTLMTKLYAEPQTPPTCGNQALDDINKWECTLIVPEAAAEVYRAAEQWKEFFFMEGGEFVDNNDIVEVYDGRKTAFTAANAEKAKAAVKSQNALFFAKRGENLGDNFVVGGKAKSVKLTDAQPFYCPAEIAAENVSYTRTFNNTNWQALYVPYAMEYEEWADKAAVAYINDVHQFDDDGDDEIDRTQIEFVSKKSGSLEPNTPYVIRALKAGAVTFNGKDKTVCATVSDGSIDCSSTRTLYTLTGTYQPKTDMFEGGYYAMSGGGFMLANNAGVALSPFRIYLEITERKGAGALKKAPQRISIVVDGVEDEACSVEGLTGDAFGGSEGHGGFNLGGQKVGRGYKGIVVRNGRKYLVK